jgi:hypothetical protein
MDILSRLLGRRPAAPTPTVPQPPAAVPPHVRRAPGAPTVPQRIREPHMRPRADEDAIAAGRDILRYPPGLRGLPAMPVADLLGAQADMIQALDEALRLPRGEFDAYILPVVEAYARYVHLLPASETQHHRAGGGLFRHGLEVAYHAARASVGTVFSLESERYRREPVWRAGTCLAGLLHDIGKPAADVTVSNRDDTWRWQPSRQSLAEALEAAGISHYYLNWIEDRYRRHEMHGPLMLRHCMPEATADWLSDADPRIYDHVLAATGGADKEGLVGALVMRGEAISVREDLRAAGYDPDAYALGVPVDRYLVDAMRELVRRGDWRCNTPGARVWHFDTGLYVVWQAGEDPVAARDIRDLLDEQGIPGIPRTPEKIAPELIARGHFQTWQDRDGEHFGIDVTAPCFTSDGRPATLQMAKLSSPALLYPHEPPPPLPFPEQARKRHAGSGKGAGPGGAAWDPRQPAAAARAVPSAADRATLPVDSETGEILEPGPPDGLDPAALSDIDDTRNEPPEARPWTIDDELDLALRNLAAPPSPPSPPPSPRAVPKPLGSTARIRPAAAGSETATPNPSPPRQASSSPADRAVAPPAAGRATPARPASATDTAASRPVRTTPAPTPTPAVTPARLPSRGDTGAVRRPETAPTAARPGAQTPADVQAWLTARGEAGSVLRALIQRQSQADLSPEARPGVHDGHVCWPWEAGLAVLPETTPLDALRALHDAGLTAIDGRRPAVRTREIGGHRVVMLTRPASERVLVLTGPLPELAARTDQPSQANPPPRPPRTGTAPAAQPKAQSATTVSPGDSSTAQPAATPPAVPTTPAAPPSPAPAASSLAGPAASPPTAPTPEEKTAPASTDDQRQTPEALYAALRQALADGTIEVEYAGDIDTAERIVIPAEAVERLAADAGMRRLPYLRRIARHPTLLPEGNAMILCPRLARTDDDT